MDDETRARIEKEASVFIGGTPYDSGYFYGYIKGATAEHSRITELLADHEAIIRELLRLLEQAGANPELESILKAKKAIEALKGKQQ